MIDSRTAFSILIVTIPLAIVGTVVKREISDADILNLVFGLGLLILAIYILVNIKKETHGPPIPGELASRRRIRDIDNNTYEYLMCNQMQGRFLTGVGAFITGLISVGIGKSVVSTLRIRYGVPMKVAIGTSVLVVTVTVLTAALTDVALIGIESVPYGLITFTIPGVVIGGQLGAKVALKVNSHIAERLLIVIFIFFGSIMAIKWFLG